MFVPKEIVQNRLMGFERFRRLAQTRHRTGYEQDPDRARRLLDQYRSLVGGDLSGASVLELGPGRGTALMSAAAPEARSYAAFDVEPYLDADELRGWGVDYRVHADGSLPWGDATFDVVWSHSVLEHVRDPVQVLLDIGRVLRPGGTHIASIDLQDHYGNRRDPAAMYGFLRYSDRLWWAMTSERSSFCNRLRASDWRRLVTAHGFEIVSEQTVTPFALLDELREVDYLANVSDDDLLVSSITLTMRTVPAAPGAPRSSG